MLGEIQRLRTLESEVLVVFAVARTVMGTQSRVIRFVKSAISHCQSSLEIRTVLQRFHFVDAIRLHHVGVVAARLLHYRLIELI